MENPHFGIVKSAAKHLLRHDVPSSLAEIAEPPVDVAAMDLYSSWVSHPPDAQFQATAKQNSGAYLGLSDRVPQDPMVDSLFPFRCVVIKQLFGGKPQFQADPFAFVEACQICTECEPQGKSFPACACP